MIKINWQSRPDEQLTELLRGTIVGAKQFGVQGIELEFADGRRVDVRVVQCATHCCDDTHMIVEPVPSCPS